MKEGMPGWSLSGSGPSSTPAWRRSWRVPGSTGPRGGTSRWTWRSTPPLVLEVYDWLVAHTPAAPHRPEGAEYPVWVSFLREGTMLPGEGAVILELELDPELITRINVAKWGAMLNYAYLPRDEADARRHRKLLSDYGASDARAFMTSFYPQIKREILDSWQRLFRHHAALGMGDRSGVGGVQAGLWCIRREWVAAVR